MPNDWQSVLDEISKHVSEMAFGTYFNNFNFVSNEKGLLKISVPGTFIQASIEKKYLDAVKDALRKNGYKFKDVEIIIAENNKKRSTIARRAIEILPNNEIRTAETITIPEQKPGYRTASSVIEDNNGKKQFVVRGTGLNPKYRLDNYVVGSNNDLAVTAARAVIENPGTRYNPYFIYGGSGLGKTHLIQAIGNEIHERYPKKKVLYVTIQQFYQDFIESIMKKIEGFTEKYRNVDVLIVDDFQFIMGRDKSQEEFFHTFNELHNANKQIIIGCDRLPSQIKTVDERLASRLTMGIPIDIQMPDFEVRCAILKMESEKLNEDVDDEIIEYLAENVRSNIRDLIGELHRVLLLADTRGVKPADLIADDGNPGSQNIITMKRRTISPKQVINKVARYYDVSAKDLLGTRRTKNIKNARQVAMYLMNEELGLSTVRIGHEFSKDHTTVMHSVKIIKIGLKKDFRLREQITELREKIYAS